MGKNIPPICIEVIPPGRQRSSHRNTPEGFNRTYVDPEVQEGAALLCSIQVVRFLGSSLPHEDPRPGRSGAPNNSMPDCGLESMAFRMVCQRVDMILLIGLGLVVDAGLGPFLKTKRVPREQLLMEEILHHLGCINPVTNGINYPPQLVQDFFHQQKD